jgi:hypothetical protein
MPDFEAPLMSETSSSFDFSGLLCFPRPNATDSYYYVPLRADLDRSPDGRPIFSLIQTGATGYLMLTAVWRATDAAVDALRQELAARTNVENPEQIELSLAPVDVARCDLLLGDGTGSFQTLATNKTSRMPPYAALFSVTLTKEQFSHVAAAVNGRAGFLAVEYDAVLPTESRASARLMPQSARFVQWLRDAEPARTPEHPAHRDALRTADLPGRRGAAEANWYRGRQRLR